VATGEFAVPSSRTALRRAFASPSGWGNGVAGFLARGGILLFALPIWVLPTPVGVSLLLGPVDVTGPPRDAGTAILALAGVAGALLLIVAAAAAVSDLAAYRRLLGGAEGPQGAGREPAGAEGPLWATEPAPASPPGPVARPGWGDARLIAALVVLEAIAVLPAAAVSVVAAGRLVTVGRAEYFLPSSLDVPFALRVVAGARNEVVALIACLVIADLVYAVLSRWLFRRRGPQLSRTAPRAPGVRAARGAGAWLGSWLITAAFVLPGLALVAETWAIVRAVVAGRGLAGSPAEIAASLAAIALLVACWGIAIVAAGASSVIRSVMWSVALLRQGPPSLRGPSATLGPPPASGASR